MPQMQYISYRIFGYGFTIVVHVTNIVYMAYTLKGELRDPTIKQFSELQARFFTCWTFFLQIVYAVLGLSCDILTLKNKNAKNYELPKYLRGCRNTLFSAVLWPSTMLVCSLFWSLFLYDRNLILPPIFDKVLTRTSNHVIHTLIVPVVLWEVAFRPRVEPASHTRNVLHLLFHLILYFCVLMYTYIERGVWIYPIFDKLYGTMYLPLIIVLIGLFTLFYYYVQWPLTRLVWKSADQSKYKIL